MPFQAVPNVAKFDMIMVGGDGQRLMCSIYVRNTALPWTATKLAATATTIGNAWRDQVMPLIATGVTFDRVDAVDLGAEFGAQAVVEYNTVGTRAGDQATYALAALVVLTCTGGAPPRKGHLFVPGLVESDVTRDLLTSTYQGLLDTAMETIDSQITGGGDAWVVVSRYSKAVTPAPPHLRPTGVSNTVDDIGVRQLVATQRDRRQGIGS